MSLLLLTTTSWNIYRIKRVDECTQQWHVAELLTWCESWSDVFDQDDCIKPADVIANYSRGPFDFLLIVLVVWSQILRVI